MKRNKKAFAALLGILLLILLYLAALITAVLNIPNWDRLFRACIAAAIGIPILLWVYLLLFKHWKK